MAKVGALLAVFFVVACGSDDKYPVGEHPTLVVRADQKEAILARLDREPYATLYARIEERAARDYREEEGDAWDHEAHQQNGLTAEAAAFIAWLQDDAEAADKVRDFFERLTTDLYTSDTWDLDIRMPATMIGYTNAWDLLAGTDFFPEDEARAAADKIMELDALFYERYIQTPFYRELALQPAQNNHPIRTACAMGYPALIFRDYPDDYPEVETYLNWAVSELTYLWGENGQYVQADGGVSEGPFYYGFAFAPTVAFGIAVENSMEPEHEYTRDCINRNDDDPWTGHGCVDGELFTFENPIREQRFFSTADWAISLRTPGGNRPPLGDALLRPSNGQAVLTGFDGPGYYRWDWEVHEQPLVTSSWHELTLQHLVYFDDSVTAEEPPWTTRFLPDAGNAVFRSSWDSDAIWMLLVAEHGSARKTLHDHVDGTSFTLAAYGEYLLIDPGYYKPNELSNSVTADAPSHNVILVDLQGAPDKGLLTNWGDADAFLENTLDGEVFDYAEAWQSYEDNDIERSVVFARSRYGVVADRLETDSTDTREYRWRLNGNAGLDAGGSFALDTDHATWERSAAGVAVYLASTAAGLALEKPEFRELKPPHVHRFDESSTLGHHEVLDGVVSGVAPGYLAVLAPYSTNAAAGDPEAPLAVTALAAAEGQAAWLVETDSGADLVLLREPAAAGDITLGDGRVVSTDAELLILGLDDGAVLVARGTQVSVDGTVVATLDASDGVAEGTASLP